MLKAPGMGAANAQVNFQLPVSPVQDLITLILLLANAGNVEQTALIVLTRSLAQNVNLSSFYIMEFVSGRLLAREGWRVIALKRKEKSEGTADTVAGIEVVRYESLKDAARLLVRIFFSAQPEVVHVYGMRNNQIGCLAAMLAKLAIILIIRPKNAGKEGVLLHYKFQEYYVSIVPR